MKILLSVLLLVVTLTSVSSVGKKKEGKNLSVRCQASVSSVGKEKEGKNLSVRCQASVSSVGKKKKGKNMSVRCKNGSCRPKPFHPKTCLDYLKKYHDSKSGVYTIYDNASNRFPVYCDMKTEPGNAWTLIMSWSHKNRALSLFRSFVFKQNGPVNENAPNFNLYRQTLSRMQSIKNHSTHWRSTCSYPTHGVDYRDYVRGNFRDFDILTFLGAGVCKKVEYINIRGHVGIHTTVKWWQGVNTWSLHTDSSSVHRGCAFQPVAGSVREEDNFGHYATTNPKFRCNTNDKSTTQWWFGGYL